MQAFQAHRFPMENLGIVQQIVDHIGISCFEDIQTRGYIKAIRTDGRKTLHIHFGYTSGFGSEAEILDSVGDVDRGSWHDGREWWVTHPVNKLRGSNAEGWGNRAGEDRAEVCPTCFMQLPRSGVCGECAM